MFSRLNLLPGRSRKTDANDKYEYRTSQNECNLPRAFLKRGSYNKKISNNTNIVRIAKGGIICILGDM